MPLASEIDQAGDPVTVFKSLSVSHPFLDGVPKKLLINGEWVEAASGRTFPTYNPATGRPIADIADGGPGGHRPRLRRRRAPRLSRSPWRKFKPSERQDILLRIADLVEERFDEFLGHSGHPRT